MKRVISLTLSMALAVAMGAQAGGVAATDTQDIPGIQLSGRTVSGLVGGSVVDAVYEIVIAPGTLFVATLRGEVGAELGLYLFAPGSTSIQTDTPTGLSAKPGANQVISLAVEGGGRFYLNVNGRNTDRAFAYSLDISLTRDSTRPTIVTFLPTRVATSQNVCTTLKASDLISGVRLVQFVDVTFGDTIPWVGYRGAGQYCFAVRPGDGVRTLQAIVRNGVGLKSVPREWTMTIDDTQPTVQSFRPAQSAVLFASRPTISWTFSERIRPAGPGSAEVFAYNQLGVRLEGAVTLSTDRRTLRWKAAASVPPGSTLLIGLNGVSDLAGNASSPIDSIELFRKRTATIALRASSRGAERVRLAYTVSSALIGRELEAEIFANGLWQSWRSVTPTATSGTFTVPGIVGSAVRLRWLGDNEVAEVKSGRVSLQR